ncbi:MAG: class I SAM-dependent methyltransferase [Desulfarculaceae bacterium]|nr:class I SAM-dependent methyltransferase [Desulfarculaceae bacterium]
MKDKLNNWANAAQSYLRKTNFLQADFHYLDLGCGYGNFSYLLQKNGINNSVGVDLDNHKIKIAKELTQSGNFIVHDAIAYLENTEQQFDVITCFDFLEHLPQNLLDKFFVLVARRLKAGGKFIIQTLNAENPNSLVYLYGDETHQTSFSTDLIKKYLTRHDFSNIKFYECGPYIHNTTSFIRYIAWHFIRTLKIIYNLIELGDTGSKVYTRVIIVVAEKR